MQSYIGIFKMEFKSELQYRAKAISGISTQLFWGILQICLYMAFMSNTSVDNFTIDQMVSYIWLGQAFFVFRFITLDNNIASQIMNGNVCYRFIRPIDIYNQWYFESLGKKASETFLRFPIVILIALILPSSFRLGGPVSFSALLLTIIGVFLSLLISITFSMFAAYLTFITLSSKGVVTIISTICALFSGSFIPLPLMPDGVQKVLSFLPFHLIGDLPFRIYIGNIGIQEGIIQLALGFVWLFILVFLGKLLIKSSLKKTIIQGG